MNAIDREMSPAELRLRCRRGEFRRPTAGYSHGFVQANLVIVPASSADDFEEFCRRNPAPCPLLERMEVGSPFTSTMADHADLRTDLPRYRIYRDGEFVAEKGDIQDEWREDFVAFLLGCSFTFENALLDAGLRVRHLEELREDGQPKNVPMYRTSVPCERSGPYFGPLVVSMRPFRMEDVPRAAEITSQFSRMHGGPVHVGDPEAIGVSHLDQPEWGDAVTLEPDEVPVFWACGVTPQAVVLASKPSLAITHAPGHMFVSDRTDGEFREVSGK